MKVANTVHTIELTPKEIDLITTALHGQYKTERELYDQDTEDVYSRFYEPMNEARDLRNAFAKLINLSFMGADA